MWLWILATLVAFFIKGLCGFANTLVFTSILAFGSNNINISPIELLVGYPPNLILTWKNRKSLKPAVFLPLALLVLLGSIPGAFLLKTMDSRLIKIIFGIVVIVVALDMLLREAHRGICKESKILLASTGVLSGILCGMFGVGALLAAYVGRVTGTSNEFKANISAAFIVENTFRFITYTMLDIITLPSLKTAAALMPFMLIGLFAGIKSSSVLPEKTVRHLVIALLIVSGIALMWQS
ncbi:MAG: sulfite exporter TauE/SafE family protein [Treponema sp.]|nr:sulfite exporter TauE/SafE family protein [Treponema sp.]